MQFRIEQDFGPEIGEAYLYFEAEGDITVDMLKNVAIDLVVADHMERVRVNYFVFHDFFARPHIEIRQTKNGKLMKNGIVVKTKWRPVCYGGPKTLK